MFCKHCGKQIPDTTRFCPYCGAGTGVAASPGTTSGNLPNSSPRNISGNIPPTPKKHPPKKSPLPLILGLIALLLVLLIGGALLFSFLSKEASSAHGDRHKSLEEGIETSIEDSGEDGQKDDEGSEGTTSSGEDGGSSENEGDEAWESTGNIIPPNSAEDDGNLFGNSHCYARAVSDGTYLYFRNAFDKEKTYWMEKGTATAYPLTDIYMKDLHYKDGWIYYSRTTEGDIAAGTRDNNIYRMKTDGSGNTNLSGLVFDNPQSWLSFETMSGGKCFFIYTDGKGISVDIGVVSENGGDGVFLSRIPAANVVDNPCINVIGTNVYFLAKDGLHCVDLTTKADSMILPGFSCEEYMIYDGVIYFVTGESQGRSDHHAALNSIRLDGTDRKELFVSPSGSGFSSESMQVNIYQGKFYFLTTTAYPAGNIQGRLYTMELDGSDPRQLMDGIRWFNIIDHTLYYRYVDEQDSSAAAGQSAPYYYAPLQSIIHGAANGSSGSGSSGSNSSGSNSSDSANRTPLFDMEASGLSHGFTAGQSASPNGSVYGYPIFDPATGLIVEYAEQYTP